VAGGNDGNENATTLVFSEIPSAARDLYYDKNLLATNFANKHESGIIFIPFALVFRSFWWQ
jgi:hypothetical protein